MEGKSIYVCTMGNQKGRLQRQQIIDEFLCLLENIGKDLLTIFILHILNVASAFRVTQDWATNFLHAST